MGIGEIEEGMRGGEGVCEIGRDLVLNEGVGVRKGDAAGDRDMDESMGAGSAQSSEDRDMDESMGAGSAQSSELRLLYGGWSLGGINFWGLNWRGTKPVTEVSSGVQLVEVSSGVQLVSLPLTLQLLSKTARSASSAVGMCGVLLAGVLWPGVSLVGFELAVLRRRHRP